MRRVRIQEDEFDLQVALNTSGGRADSLISLTQIKKIDQNHKGGNVSAKLN